MRTLSISFNSNILPCHLIVHKWDKPSLAAADDDDTCKNEQGGENFLPAEAVHTYAYADCGGNDGLNVRVHAHQGRAQLLLPVRYEIIAHKGGEKYQECEFEQNFRRNGTPVEMDQFTHSERKRHQSGEEKDPFHKGAHAVFTYQRLEYAQVQREAQAVDNEQQYSLNRIFLHPGGIHTPEHQEQHTTEAHQYASSLLESERLLDGNGSNEHSVDRGERAHDGAGHRSDLRYGHEKRELAAEITQKGSEEYLDKIPCFNPFPGKEKRDQPEQSAGTY